MELQPSASQRRENYGTVNLAHFYDEPRVAETDWIEMEGYDVSREYSYPEELTPEEAVRQFYEYQPLDRVTMDWEIARSKVSIIKVIGEGAFGQVAKATVMGVRGIRAEIIVAVKMLKGLLIFNQHTKPFC